MSRSINILLKASLFVFLTTGILGLYLLASQQESSALLCAKIGGLASLVYTAIAIRDVLTSPKLPASSKVLWVVALMMLQVLAGVWYYLSGRSATHQSLPTQ